MPSTAPLVSVTGANGLVGAQICQALYERDVPVRAIVRRVGTAPQIANVTELVGDFTDPDFAATLVADAGAVVSTVHPMGSDRATQHRIGVDGTATLARAAAAAGTGRLIHISTAAVYDRSPGVGDVQESSRLVDDQAGDYPVTKRDTDHALVGASGITRILVRPPAILGSGPTSVWNTLRPTGMRDDASARRANPKQTFPWVHVADLAALAADLACGAIADADDPAAGPVPGACVPVNVGVADATLRDYYGAVTGALGVQPEWEDGPAWTGQYRARRAEAWGWRPAVDLGQGLAEVAADTAQLA